MFVVLFANRKFFILPEDMICVSVSRIDLSKSVFPSFFVWFASASSIELIC